MKRLLTLLPLLASCSTEPPQLKEMGEFSVMQYKVTQIVGQRDSSLFRFLGDKEILYSVSAYIEVGIDTREIEVTDSLVTIPHCKVLQVSVPEEEIACIYCHVGGFSTDYTPEERLAVRQAGERAIKNSLGQYPLLSEGDIVLMNTLSSYYNNIAFR